MKKLVALSFLGLSLFLTAGSCANNWVEPTWVETENGKEVLCIGTSDSGISCNWEGYNKQ